MWDKVLLCVHQLLQPLLIQETLEELAVIGTGQLHAVIALSTGGCGVFVQYLLIKNYFRTENDVKCLISLRLREVEKTKQNTCHWLYVNRFNGTY